MRISLIVAGCQVEDPKKLGIGLDGNLPWRLSQEMKHFTKMTKSGGNNAVLMGRKTWESIPTKFRPLKDRYNVVITTQNAYELNCSKSVAFNTIQDALDHLVLENKYETCWVIGGSAIYNHFIENNLCHRIYLTEIKNTFECDRYFPKIDMNEYKEIHDENVSSEKA